jgi:hypothetical protein
MKFFKKIKADIKRYRLFHNPLKWPDYIHDNMVDYLIAKDCKYLENKKTHYIKISFGITESHSFYMDYYIDGGSYFYRGVIMDGIPEERMRDAMVMASHINNKLRFSNVFVDPDSKIICLILKIDTPMCIHSPSLMHEMLGTHYDECMFSFEAFEKLFQSDEDPVFIIAEIVERIKQKNKNQGNTAE